MLAVFTNADALLRGQLSLTARRDARDLLTPIMLVLIFGSFYGVVMGTFSATTPARMIQLIFSGVKVPMLLLVTFMISLPSFFVLNALLGLRRDFVEAVIALITTQAALTIILSSLAPLTALWYASDPQYRDAILINGVMFAIASASAQVLLRRLYRPLIERNPRHRLLLRLWLVIYVFVGIQMGWVLRPFVGSPFIEPHFFREGAFSNAYMFVGRLIWDIFAR